MYDKVRVKKSQIFEVRQDTSQKETKNPNWAKITQWAPLGSGWAPPTHIFGSGRFLDFWRLWARSRGFWRLFLHGFGRLFKLNVRVNYIDFDRILEANYLEATLDFLVFQGHKNTIFGEELQTF